MYSRGSQCLCVVLAIDLLHFYLFIYAFFDFGQRFHTPATVVSNKIKLYLSSVILVHSLKTVSWLKPSKASALRFYISSILTAHHVHGTFLVNLCHV